MSTNIKLLIVEDNLIAQTVANMILSNLGCQVELAIDGETAIQMFTHNPSYDLIFMDVGLPGISGLDVTREIRKLEIAAKASRNPPTQTKPVPIVALTANYDDSSKAICLDAGMNDFLLKPLSKASASNILSKFFPSENTIWSTINCMLD